MISADTHVPPSQKERWLYAVADTTSIMQNRTVVLDCCCLSCLKRNRNAVFIFLFVSRETPSRVDVVEGTVFSPSWFVSKHFLVLRADTPLHCTKKITRFSGQKEKQTTKSGCEYSMADSYLKKRGVVLLFGGPFGSISF